MLVLEKSSSVSRRLRCNDEEFIVPSSKRFKTEPKTFDCLFSLVCKDLTERWRKRRRSLIGAEKMAFVFPARPNPRRRLWTLRLCESCHPDLSKQHTTTGVLQASCLMPHASCLMPYAFMPLCLMPYAFYAFCLMPYVLCLYACSNQSSLQIWPSFFCATFPSLFGVSEVLRTVRVVVSCSLLG